MEIWQLLIIFGSGVIAGFINTLAGGGSFLTLPMLIFLGLPAVVANGTNRIAITVQSIFAVTGFRRKGISGFKSSLLLSVPSCIGAVIGAQLAVITSDILFKRILAVIMIFFFGVIFWDPIRSRYSKTMHAAEITELSRSRYTAVMAAMFFAGIYGGFVQAGVGFLFIMVLNMIGRLNLVKTNSHKVFVVGINALFSVFVFLLHGKIYWITGIVLAAGTGLGGWIGSNLAVSKGERFVRVVLAICVIAIAARLLV
ncbi:MAG: sulfite exporter TauE/SafE family protein [Candidatus Loosdrechtia sp.]|uniref:sulfite exporter TauE/SafE family protein n=1 Tax=Candidatus Loosdrechtia sp. TaxID=3101272 RepID=UPI00403B0FFC